MSDVQGGWYTNPPEFSVCHACHGVGRSKDMFFVDLTGYHIEHVPMETQQAWHAMIHNLYGAMLFTEDLAKSVLFQKIRLQAALPTPYGTTICAN